MIIYIIISILLTVSVIMIRKDTIIIKYDSAYRRDYAGNYIYTEYNLDKLPIYEYAIIIFISSIPIVNIIAFIMLLTVYYVCINNGDGYLKIYKLKGSNFITKFILWTNEIFKYKI